MRGYFWCGKLAFFLFAVGLGSPPSAGFPPNGRLGGRSRAVYTWWGVTSKIKGGETFFAR